MAVPDPKWLLREAMSAMAKGDGLVYMDEAVPALTEFVREFAAPEFSCTMHGLPPTPPTTFRGIDGFQRGWEDYASAFERVRAELYEIRESPEHLVVLVNQVAVTRHGGVEMTQPSAIVFAFEGDRIFGVEFHLDHAAALRAGGLEPEGS
ncbi:MAG: nuclear transport factor 2 family protein [Solirubrobacterales bacterium]